MNINDINPLGTVPKREKAGAKTFKKYLYQYHWAFCRLLDEHNKKNEYAIFIEEHEDVTIADSLDVTKSKFEFNQVKDVSKPYTIMSITKNKKGGSVLYKMACGVKGKTFSDKIKSVNLVSTGGFSFQLHKKGFSYEVIDTGKLEKNEVETIKEHLENEFGDASLISNLAFIIPSLQSNDFENAIKGRISDLMHEQARGHYYNSKIVYDCIINDLYRKGTNCFDYTNWEDAIKRKAITSKQVQDIINTNLNRKPDDSLYNELNRILSEEYMVKSVARRNITIAFERYYSQCLNAGDLTISEVSREISELIDRNINSVETAKELEKCIREKTSEKVNQYFNSCSEYTGAFLYEFLRRVNG